LAIRLLDDLGAMTVMIRVGEDRPRLVTTVMMRRQPARQDSRQPDEHGGLEPEGLRERMESSIGIGDASRVVKRRRAPYRSTPSGAGGAKMPCSSQV
jgi:hypothetical protein